MHPTPMRGAASRDQADPPPLPSAARGPPRRLLTVVGLGASAGGLEATRKLLGAMPAECGMAFVLVQHLDPTHPSMMVELLAGHTTMTVAQATRETPLEANHLYVVPAGLNLTISGGCLHLSGPVERHGARLPFDFFLRSLAHEYGSRAICVVLSGMGADGSAGLRAIKQEGGLIIAQDQDEAGYGEMPSNAIQTGCVDLILRVAQIPEALERYRQRQEGMAKPEAPAEDLPAGATRFFHDPAVFGQLADTVIPEAGRDRAPDWPLRVWVAGCSTGEQTYSLVMLFMERALGPQGRARLQFFASDRDAEAIATARDGLYSPAIEADVSTERLARFFVREDQGYRVTAEMRGAVIFTVHDMLTDPPFSRLDLVLCSKLPAELPPEAQATVIALFHFALSSGGTLVLGGEAAASHLAGRFEAISEASRIYRRVGRSRLLGAILGGTDESGLFPMAGRQQARIGLSARPPRDASAAVDLADIGRRLLIDSYAPAAILLNHRHECLFLYGPTERYLRISPGRPTYDLLAMVQPALRNRLRSAIRRAIGGKGRIIAAGGRALQDGKPVPFNIEIQPVSSGSENLLLVCFVDAPASQAGVPAAVEPSEPVPRVLELQSELASTQAELQVAVHELELASEEQRAISEEALSANEEYQSTNEELLTSKEELQSLNEELTALNSQLQEALERQRTTSDDLEHVLYSTDYATLFLDAELRIRFFTPSTKLLFAVIPGDVGRPLADLRSLAADNELPGDAAAVLQYHAPIEREIQTQAGLWFRRRILPYRAHSGRIEGVVITFADITRRKAASQALEDAKQQAEQANLAKSRFLAAASHDLRQPLQTFALLHGLLARTVKGEREKQLLVRLDDTLGAMSGMLNALLDINQIEAGVVRPVIMAFPIDALLGRLRDEFGCLMEAKGLSLRVVPCRLQVTSDQRLLEQILRNLLSNALKYTERGRVLLGCRRRGAMLSIEVWDTGIGIPAGDLKSIFQEFHQIGNLARERSHGLGLGLSIVQRLADLLDHRVGVRSWQGKGSVFTIEVGCPVDQVRRDALPEARPAPAALPPPAAPPIGRASGILVVEDDPEVRDLLQLFLTDEGYRAVAVADGAAALDAIARGVVSPALVLADFNLPGRYTGLQLASRIREECGRAVPIVILTGDISAATLRDAAERDCLLLNKPVQLAALSELIRTLAPPPVTPAPAAGASGGPIGRVLIVDDDPHICQAIGLIVAAEGAVSMAFATGEAFLEGYVPSFGDCVLIDATLPGVSGLEVLRRLRAAGHGLPAIVITGRSDVAMAVEAMKAGAADFIEKPIGAEELLAVIRRALEHSPDAGASDPRRRAAVEQLSSLTARQGEVMKLVLAGQPSKNIAADLGISQRTVENHRAAIMKKTQATSLPALARLAMAAAWLGEG